MPITALEDAQTSTAGWVGRRWSNGTLMIGINPGGGGDKYRRNPTDDRLYSLVREFRCARDPEEQSRLFEELSVAWIDIQRGHNIWRVITAILEATGETIDQCAFMNILPFRTRMDAPAPAVALRTAWSVAAEPQIATLCPNRIIALGKRAWDVLTRMTMPIDSDLILIKRAIGDSYIPSDSRAVLAGLRGKAAR